MSGRPAPAAAASSLVGPAGRMQDAFSTRLSRYRSPRANTAAARVDLHVPAGVAPAIEAVLGLDDRPQATTAHRASFRMSASSRRGRPRSRRVRIAELYDFPRNLDGSGQRIAVIELGGGFRRSRLRRYFEKLGTPMPKISAVSVDGARNRPGHRPCCRRRGGARHRGDRRDRPRRRATRLLRSGERPWVRGRRDDRTVRSARPFGPLDQLGAGRSTSGRSRGATRSTSAFRTAAALGVTVCAASGDNGWTDGVAGRVAHVDYPASSPTSSPAAAPASRRRTAGSPRSCGTTTTATPPEEA